MQDHTGLGACGSVSGGREWGKGSTRGLRGVGVESMGSKGK